MRFDPVLVEARLVDRPNRFVARIRLGREVRLAHVHDPGRLEELLYPGARVWVRRAPAGRKTAYDVMLARQGRAWVSVYSSLPNRLVDAALRCARLPELPFRGPIRAEVRDGDSRFDFLLPTTPPTWLEVKSVTLVKDRVALFPDAPTTRGKRHLDHLSRLASAGAQASLMFVVQRPDADAVRPYGDRDPAFAASLRQAAQSGVRLLARTCHVSPGRIDLARRIPVEPF